MTPNSGSAAGSREGQDTLELTADVLVIGGGPAATWAALTARAEGARVLLVDKGFCGSSGVAAAATIGHWWVPPEGREQAIVDRDAAGGYLSERSWMERVLEETWRRWPEVSKTHGYPASGLLRRLAPGQRLCQGPIFLREMRRRVSRSGVRILDHAPALELLRDADGAVCGAAGVLRQKGRRWRASAGAVVLATGGCAWKSGSLGSNVDTGDGYLMAAEVGAKLSGMEFSNFYGIVPVGSSMDKNGFYLVATFTDADGNEVAKDWNAGGGVGRGVAGGRSWLMQAAFDGPLYAKLDKAPPEARAGMRAQMPNFFITFDRLGINPFTERFEIEFILEGTVRGTGGLRVVDDTCWTGIPGLWAAGDAASREAIVGGASGAGAPNAAWTISSGTWSGRAAAAHALARVRPTALSSALPAGRVGLRPSGSPLPADAWRELSRAVQEEMLPPEKNGLRSAAKLTTSTKRLDGLWGAAREGLVGSVGREAVWARETASMIAVGRWAYLAAAARTESRAMHVRLDHPELDPEQRRRIVIDGVDQPQLSFVEIADPVVAFDDELAREAA
jgi:succinate dehydrogenase/fumarate reductase flavoprotein subunit